VPSSSLRAVGACEFVCLVLFALPLITAGDPSLVPRLVTPRFCVAERRRGRHTGVHQAGACVTADSRPTTLDTQAGTAAAGPWRHNCWEQPLPLLLNAPTSVVTAMRLRRDAHLFEQQLTRAFFCIALFVDQQTSPPCRLFRLSPPFAAFAALSSRFFCFRQSFFVRSSIVRRSVRPRPFVGFRALVWV
jgi:hypothetical protein